MLSLQTAPYGCAYSTKYSAIRVWDRLPDCQPPGGTWNAHRHKRSETVAWCGGQRWRLTPHTPPQHHPSTPPPQCTPPLQVCLWLNGGRGALWAPGYRVSFRKKRRRLSGLAGNGARVYSVLNCSVVKTAWPLGALPAAERPFLCSPGSQFYGTLLSVLFLWDWFLLVALNAYLERLTRCCWITIWHLR